MQSAFQRAIKAGVTRSDEGVPIGLVNWMVLQRRPTIRAVRVGQRYGYMWFKLDIGHEKARVHIWEDLPCNECFKPFDDNPGKAMCKTCEDWMVEGK